MNKITNFRFLLCTIIFALILGLPISAIATPKLSMDNILQREGYHAIPITTTNGFLYIKTSANKNPSIAIIDTGSSEISVTKGAAEKLKLVTFNTTKNAGVDMYGKKSFMKSVVLPNVTIGNIQLGNVTANILQYVSSNNIPTLVIGRVFLNQHHAIIDIDKKKLYLGRKKLSHVEMNEIQSVLLHQQLQSVPLMSLGSGSLVIPLQINQSQPVNFLFDTGTGITLLSQAYAKKLNLKQRNESKQMVIKKLIMNPLNLSFQPKIFLNDISVQLDDLTMLTKYLYVQGIFGLPDMIKANAIIFLEQGIVYFRSAQRKR